LVELTIEAVALQGPIAMFHAQHRLPKFREKGGCFFRATAPFLRELLAPPVVSVDAWAADLRLEAADAGASEWEAVKALRGQRRPGLLSPEALRLLEKALVAAWRRLSSHGAEICLPLASVAIENDQRAMDAETPMSIRQLIFHVAHVVGVFAGRDEVYVSAVLVWFRDYVLQAEKGRLLGMREALIIARTSSIECREAQSNEEYRSGQTQELAL